MMNSTRQQVAGARKQRVIGVAVALLASVVGLAGTGDALETSMQGTTCVPRLGAVANSISYSFFGAQNNSTTAVSAVECGGVLVPSGTVTEVRLTGYDRDPNESLCCAVKLQNSLGFTEHTGNLCLGGFSSAPLNASLTLPNGGITTHVATFTCTIPKKTANGLSHVTRLSLVRP